MLISLKMVTTGSMKQNRHDSSQTLCRSVQMCTFLFDWKGGEELVQLFQAHAFVMAKVEQIIARGGTCASWNGQNHLTNRLT
jgi:hypothetical protein